MKSISSSVSDSVSSNSSTPRGSTNQMSVTTPTDEPIHIINIGLRCDDIAELDDSVLSAQCSQFVQVSFLHRLKYFVFYYFILCICIFFQDLYNYNVFIIYCK